MEKRLASASRPIRKVLEASLEGKELGASDARALFETRAEDLQALLETADAVRRRRVGETVTFVVVRNINFTNICYTGCRFCGFAKREGDPEAEFLSLEEIARRTKEAAARGATEVCMQGGLHPRMKAEDYCAIVRAVKEAVPEIHVHAFSPFEIKYGAGRSRISVEEFLLRLKEEGLGTIPGTAAEILDTRIRKTLTKDKLSAREWVEIVKTAHRLGIRSSSTMMYGHVDGPAEWVAHFETLREIQKETGGFTEFVPLGFVHYDAPIYLDGVARPGPTREENFKVHAVARLFFQGWIDNIQVSWVKLGPRMAQYILQRGANDFGGTLMNESISRSAGARFGEEISPAEFCRYIREIGRIPAQRNTVYEIVARYETTDPPSEWEQPLAPVH